MLGNAGAIIQEHLHNLQQDLWIWQVGVLQLRLPLYLLLSSLSSLPVPCRTIFSSTCPSEVSVHSPSFSLFQSAELNTCDLRHIPVCTANSLFALLQLCDIYLLFPSFLNSPFSLVPVGCAYQTVPGCGGEDWSCCHFSVLHSFMGSEGRLELTKSS